MSPLSPADHHILKKLIADSRLDVAQAEELVQMLALHRVKDPSASVCDLLVQRKIISPSDANKLLLEIERSPAPAASAGRPVAALGGKLAAPRARRRARISGAHQKPKGRGTLIAAGVAIWLVACAGLVFWIVNRNKEPAAGPESTVAQPATPDAAARPVAAKKTMDAATLATFENRLSEAQREQNLGKRLDLLSALLGDCPSGDFATKVEQVLAGEKRRIDQECDVAFRVAETRSAELIASGDTAQAERIYDELIDRYGQNALDGRVRKARDELRARVADGKLSNKVEKTIATAEPSRPAKEPAPVVGESSKTPAVPPEKSTKPEVAEKPKTEPADDAVAKEKPKDAGKDAAAAAKEKDAARMAAIRERLGELLQNGTAALDEEGILDLRYNIGAKSFDVAEDWLPRVAETPDLKAKVRWTVMREERLHVAGLRISDDGYFVHDAVLKPPIEMEVTMMIMSQFHPSNLVAAAWVTKEGKGVGGVCGRQTVTFGKFQPSGRRVPDKMPELADRQTITFKMGVGPDYLTTESAGHKPEPREVPKGMESGHCALIWSGNVACIVTDVAISGRLDLDWAEKQLAK